MTTPRLRELKSELEETKPNRDLSIHILGYEEALEHMKPVLDAAKEVLDTPSGSRLPKQLEARQKLRDALAAMEEA